MKIDMRQATISDTSWEGQVSIDNFNSNSLNSIPKKMVIRKDVGFRLKGDSIYVYIYKNTREEFEAEVERFRRMYKILLKETMDFYEKYKDLQECLK